MDWNLVFAMLGIHALMFLTPGPDSIVVISRATSQSLRHSFAAVLGIVSAGFVYVPAIAFGMDFVNELSPAIWMAIKATGALYLMYVGYKILLHSYKLHKARAHASETEDLRTEEPLYAAFIQGFLTNLGNPKMIVLLTAFLPQFVAVELGYISTQILVLGCLMYLNGLICLSLIAWVAVYIQKRISSRFGSKNLSYWGANVAGAAMVAVGIWLVFAPAKFVFKRITA